MSELIETTSKRNLFSLMQTIFGLLKDNDRIFTNLYGQHDWHLKEAIALVCSHFCLTSFFKIQMINWMIGYETKEIVLKSSTWIIAQIKKSGLRSCNDNAFPSDFK